MKNKRNKVTINYGMKAPNHPLMIDSITVAEFMPNEPNSNTQVHMIIDIKRKKETLVMRFDSPDTIGDLIEQLNFYRNRVWPSADSLDLNKDFEGEI